MVKKISHIVPFCAVLLALPLVAFASTPEFEIIIKDHRFQPEALEVPADTKIKIKIKNHDLTPEEFESYELNREKVVTGQGEIVLFIDPLKPGEYKFFGEFNQDTAQGKLVVK